jgi:hypothetical protein
MQQQEAQQAKKAPVFRWIAAPELASPSKTPHHLKNREVTFGTLVFTCVTYWFQVSVARGARPRVR